MTDHRNRTGQSPAQARPAAVRKAVIAMYAAAALSAITILAVILNQETSGNLASRMTDAWPDYSANRIEEIESITLTWLFTVGTVQAVGWLLLARTSRAGRKWVRPAAPALLAAGIAITVVHFTEPFPALVTVTWALPHVAGLAAVAFLWRSESSAYLADRGATA